MSNPAIALPPGYRLAFHETLDSTNAEALRRVAEGESHGLWVWARTQEAGRGRLGRRWHSLEGNLFASLLLRLQCPPATAAQLGFVAGLALHDAVVELAGARPARQFLLKWPNDLLCGDRKAGGILLEGTDGGASEAAIVAGVGLNLSTHPDDADYPATSLAEHGIVAGPAQALERLAAACAGWLDVWAEGRGFAEIRQEWSRRTLPLGAPIRIRLAGETAVGAFGGIDDDGALVLVSETGERRITAGDVFPL